MKLYKEYLNECFTLNVPEDIYENDLKYESYTNFVNEVCRNYFDGNIKLYMNCYRAIMSYCKAGKSYVIHKFKEYYGINMILNEFEPVEISSEIKPFDKETVYPIQEIQITIDWVY